MEEIYFLGNCIVKYMIDLYCNIFFYKINDEY